MLNLDKDKHYLLACSFGPDSMALFVMLLNEGYKFDVAHVNYHFRKASDLEEQGLTLYCKQHNVRCYIFDNKKKVTSNLEEEARNIRYTFFKSLIEEYHFDALLVAHHLDDNIETYLLQKQRNILPSYYGLKEENQILDMKVIRPLLLYEKQELMNFCNKEDVPYMIDESNADVSLQRNKIRHDIISRLTKEDKLNYLELINSLNVSLLEMKENIMNVDLSSVNELVKLDDTKLSYALFKLANGKIDVSIKLVEEVKKLLKSHKPNGQVKKGKYAFIKEYEHFAFREIAEPIEFIYQVDKPCLLDTPYFFFDLSKDQTKRHIEQNDYPLEIRPIKNGDNYLIKNYQVEIRRLYIDWKMPLSLRKRWPVVVNKDNKVIYVPRYQKDFIIYDNCDFYVKIDYNKN